MGIERDLADAHKIICQAGFELVIQLSKRKFSKRRVRICIYKIGEAKKILSKMVSERVFLKED